MSCPANKSNKVISQSEEISPTERCLAAETCLLLTKFEIDRNMDLFWVFLENLWMKWKNVWFGVSCFLPGMWVLRNHVHSPHPLVYLKPMAWCFWLVLFHFEGNRMTIISREYESNMLIDIILDCPTWIEIRRYFIQTCQNHIILYCLVFLLFVKPQESTTF